MADDPRKVAAALVLRYAVLQLVSGVELPEVIDDVLEAVDAADPWRVMLADEDRALKWLQGVFAAHAESVRHAIAAKVAPPRTTQQAVLAALREVAGL